MTRRLFCSAFQKRVFTGRDLDPIHTHDLCENWTVTQEHFVGRTFVSIIKRRVYGILLSKVVIGPENRPLKLTSPFSKARRKPGG